ncbi:MAG: PAS domain S-box protein [Microcoleus sp. SIO2G3]|nr:PAS domain S-box protein [Microcoleus sp. SIO2G3]
MRTSNQIKAEIEEKFGFFHPFFAPALETPQVLENLWQQTLSAYVGNPLSPLFKEKISAYLSRYCPVPYCMICHSCSLRPLGVRAQEVLQLLESPPPTEAEIDEHLSRLAAYPDGLTLLPEANSALEESLLYCSIFIAMEREEAEYCRSELRRILGQVNYQHLVSFIAYVRTCHAWMEAHPEIAYQYEADKRVQEHLGVLLADEPTLIDFFDNYTETVKRERQTWAERMATIAERKRNEEALRQSERKYRSVVDAIKEVIFQTDIKGRWTFLNPAWGEITGFSLEQSLGKAFIDYVHPDDCQLSREQFYSLVSGQKNFCRYEVRYLTVDGGFRWLEVEARLTLNPDSTLLGTSGILYDITERKQAEAEIRNALQKEKELNELKSCFVSTTSHEFRTPLTTILSSAELLEHYSQKWSEDKKRSHLQRIQNMVQHMTQLLNDVLLIGKAEAGKLEFNPAPLDLAQFCLSLVEEFQLGKASTQDVITKASVVFVSGQNLNSGTSGELALLSKPVSTCMDEKLLRHIFSNLLSNAIKYSPSGSTVRWELNLTDTKAIFQIQDQGIGIPPKDQARLFESFHRASNVGQIPGTGLGLAIVKKAVELHKGTIQVRSELGVGTTFIVTLPLQ